MPTGYDGAADSTAWFEGAYFHESFSLPQYNQIILIGSVDVLSVEITPVITEPVPANELHLIGDTVPQNHHEVFSSQKQKYLRISFVPFFLNHGIWERIIEAKIIVTSTAEPAESRILFRRIYKVASVLSTGQWYKMGVGQSGVYRITYADLQNMGFDPSTLDPRNIAVFGNGGRMLPEANSADRIDDLFENAVYVFGEDDGVFNQNDYILFYGESPDVFQFDTGIKHFTHTKNLYSDASYYFITVKSGPGLRIATEAQSTAIPDLIVTEFDDRRAHENDSSNLIMSGSQWFGEEFYYQLVQTFSFSVPNISASSAAWIRSSVAARSTSVSSFTIKAGSSSLNQSIYPVPYSYNTEFAVARTDTMSFAASGNQVNVEVRYNAPNSSAKGWLNYLLLNLRRELKFTSGQMAFRDALSVDSGKVTRFEVSNANAGTVIWDITNPLLPSRLSSNSSGSTLSFTVQTDSLREFIAWDGTMFLSPALIGNVANQNLHGSSQYDMIIITHPTLKSQAQRLAKLHSDVDQLSVLVVEPQLIYNEFSSGKQDVSAIRDFVKMFYDRATIPDEAPKYLLLFGDASYDPKNRLPNNTNLIPTYQSAQSLHPAYSWATDDYFGLLDNNEGQGAAGHLDIGIGRFPVQNEQEAKEMVDKVFRYLDRAMHPDALGIASPGDWRNVVAFVGDDEDGNLHMQQADMLANYVDTAYREYNIDKIYLDAYQQVTASGGQRYPEVQEAITRRVTKGALILNYTGHGGEVGWALERILEVSDIMSWNNKWNMPAFVTATCEFSRFDDPKRVSAGELAFLNAEGGAISLFTTSRLAFSNSNYNLNRSFFEAALPKHGQNTNRMGDIIRLAKVGSGSLSSNRNFLLIGDPALALSYPMYNVTTTEINGVPVSGNLDTIKALSEVTVKGEIRDWQNNKLTWFNGEIFPSVFDKPTVMYTLGNDPTSSPMPFSLQKNILYKGRASVVDGEFSFTFITPKDISYTFGNGRISYYANDGESDAHGYFDAFIVGGTNSAANPDTQGPDILLYMNDTNFIDGGITNPDPVLLAYLYDENGMNTVGNGIGHDIVSVLDGDAARSIVLNDYYEADIDNYKSGTVRFPFSGLSLGQHEIEFRAWDVYNNSTTKTIRFVVAESSDFILQSLLSYPNPFNDFTDIWFEHNLPGSDATAMVQIFDQQGRIVRTFTNLDLGNGFRTGPVRWHGENHQGSQVGRGMYFYRVSLLNQGSVVASDSGTLILIR